MRVCEEAEARVSLRLERGETNRVDKKSQRGVQRLNLPYLTALC
jgi:hypothetical protein